MTKPSVVFFGSGPVAAKSLKLLSKNFEIEAIVTKPTTIGTMQSAAPDAPLFTVTNKSDLDQLIKDQNFTSNVGVLIDFGIIVSQYVIDYFARGIVNSHFSLLPHLRGADPITFSILSGQETTGVSLMMLVPAMDEGPLLSQIQVDIDAKETTESLTDKLIDASNQSLREILPLWLTDRTISIPQDQATIAPDSTPTYSRKLTKQDGLLDWSKPATQLEREVRAYSTWPRSFTTIAGKDVIVCSAHTEPQSMEYRALSIEIGSITATADKKIQVVTSDGLLIIDSLQPAGKKQMTAESFLAGHRHLL